MNLSNIKFSVFLIILILVFFTLQNSFWFSETGYFELQTLKSSVSSLNEKVKNKSQENKELYSEVLSLRKSDSVLESLARENMGYIKEGEVFYSTK